MTEPERSGLNAFHPWLLWFIDTQADAFTPGEASTITILEYRVRRRPDKAGGPLLQAPSECLGLVAQYSCWSQRDAHVFALHHSQLTVVLNNQPDDQQVHGCVYDLAGIVGFPSGPNRAPSTIATSRFKIECEWQDEAKY